MGPNRLAVGQEFMVLESSKFGHESLKIWNAKSTVFICA
jgi:hypothetical protein